MTKEIYTPTAEDIVRIKPISDKLKISGDGVFATLQGEGVTAGLPAVFLRLHYCNLTCGEPTGWKCDTQYTWNKKGREYWQEPKDWDYKETACNINQAWNEKFGKTPKSEKRLVITGGEPLLQQAGLVEVMQYIYDWKVEIETNGTILPLPELNNVQFNCSPKLKNSGNPLKARYKPEILQHINLLQNSWFKFVVVNEKDLEEIDEIARKCGIDDSKILIMPEGQTAQEVEKNASKLIPYISAKNWNITYRNQLIWFGSRRKT